MKKLISFLLGGAIAVSAMGQTLAFPTAEGFGKYASGGRGGEVVEVTNLLDDPTTPPEGSFRWALKQHTGKPITIVFRVSGIIDLKGNDLRSMRDNITIAGQTAPGDGICFKGGCLNLGGSRNIIIRHIRSRVGVLGEDSTYCPGEVNDDNFIAGASLNIENGGNFIVDHCTFSWSAEEVTGFYDNDHTTVQWCICSEGLYNAGHIKGNRSYGSVWGGKTATYHHNLLAHNYSRSPRLGATTKNDKHMLLDIVNNVNYNWAKKNACYGGDNRQGNDGLFQVNYVNNYYKPGPARPGTENTYFIGASYCNPAQGSQGESYGDWHLDGNYMEGTYAENHGYNTNNYNGFDIDAYTDAVPGLTLDDMKSDHIDVGEYGIETQTAKEAYESVLNGAGAFPRDSQDLRVIDEVRNGTAKYYGTASNGIIDKPSDAGGYPEYKTYNEIVDNDHDGMADDWETANGFDPTDPSDRNVVLKSGYTALDAYLCSLVGETIAIERATAFDIIVAQDGSGDCTTINAAIEKASEDADRTVIFVKNGIYNEKVFIGNRWADSKKVISIIGENVDSVIITWDDYHGKTITYPGKDGEIQADGMTAATMTVTSPDFYMENVTVRNTVTESVAQAEALYQSGDRQILKNVSLEGYQDTHRTKKGRRYFYYGCTISGTVDFIYGGGTAYFYKSNIVSRQRPDSKSGGYITAPEDVTYKVTLTDGNPLYYEFIFNDCDVTAETGASKVDLGRPWGDSDCGTVFMNSHIGSHITATGWGGSGNRTNMCFAEYNSLTPEGTPIDVSGRASWSCQLADEDMHLLNLENIYAAVSSTEFSPEATVIGVSAPQNLENNEGQLSWSGVSGARGYIVYVDGEIVGMSDRASYTLPTGTTGTVTVRAIAQNGALSAVNGTADDMTAEDLSAKLNPYSAVESNERVITAIASPEDGGTVSPTEINCKAGESVTFTATPAVKYLFKNWTDQSGNVLSTETTLTFTVESNTTVTANFVFDPDAHVYYSPVAGDKGYELIDMTLFAEQNSSNEWTIKSEYMDWVSYSASPVQVSGRSVQIDPLTDEKVSYYTYSTNNMIRVGTVKFLTLYITGTTKAKIYFNGAASTAGHLVVDVTANGEDTTVTYESANEMGKKTSDQSDTLEFSLDENKEYKVIIKGTQDMALWALKLWPGETGGIDDICVDVEMQDGRIYNLKGQLITNPQPGQIYVKKGGKYLVK